jgi:GNAT superfamily N-acetyltransferase
MQRQLKDGLLLRSLSEGHASDREQLPQIYADVNGENDSAEIKAAIIGWVNDLMSGHPTVTLDDIFVVVDPANHNKVVSATLLIPQTWRYEGIPIAVGRPELVATYPEYRGHGLVRSLFETVHERSAALGHQMQAITGIPYFYRKFGYTMAVDLAQHATYPLNVFPDPAADYVPKFTLRPATVEDIPNLMRWYDYHAQGRLLTEKRSAEVWQYEMMGRSADSGQAMDFEIILNSEKQPVGYLEFLTYRWEKHLLTCTGFVIGEESNYLESFSDVINGIKKWAREKYGECPPLLSLGSGQHETLDTLIDRTEGGLVRKREYAWYVRVPEMIPFLRHIQPVLERRLVNSGANRYTGELKIGFYDLKGISLKFECGCITGIEPISGKDGYDISFPWELFWNVVFGYHTADELRYILPDVWASSKAAVLLDTLFPKQKSWLKGFV